MSLENDVFKLEESVSYYNICVVLKDCIYRDISISVDFVDRYAVGKCVDGEDEIAYHHND